MRGLSICLLVACSSSSAPLPDARFANAPPVYIVNDRRDVPHAPKAVPDDDDLAFFDKNFHRRVTRGLELPGRPRALGVNALDEVPDSTWFTNRDVRAMSPADIRRGPTEVGSPEPYTPWTILSTKPGGGEIGFVMVDRRGEKFVLKPDLKDFPEMESAAHVIVNRLLWALGYLVPEDHVVYVHPRDLVLAPDAKVKHPLEDTPLDRVAFERLLARCSLDARGRLRATASRVIEGKVLGHHNSEGVRRDDPNDVIPHERRRDLRGLYPIFAWVDQLDAKDFNTLDVWVADAKDPSRHYVEHYFIDFGKSLGVGTSVLRDPRMSHAYRLDFGDQARSLITLGLLEREWEDRTAPAIRGVGVIDIDKFDPGTWKPFSASYVPFLFADARDNLWGAKLLMRLTPAQIRAAVESGRYTDPRATGFVTAALIARQRKTALHWFDRASPLDHFRVRGDALCFDDLMITYALAPVAAETRYEVSLHDREAAQIASSRVLGANPRGRNCFPLVVAAAPDRYTIVKIVTHRRGRPTTIYVHLARPNPTTPPRVIGIWRA